MDQRGGGSNENVGYVPVGLGVLLLVWRVVSRDGGSRFRPRGIDLF